MVAGIILRGVLQCKWYAYASVFLNQHGIYFWILQELQMHENDIGFLAPEYKQILGMSYI